MWNWGKQKSETCEGHKDFAGEARIDSTASKGTSLVCNSTQSTGTCITFYWADFPEEEPYQCDAAPEPKSPAGGKDIPTLRQLYKLEHMNSSFHIKPECAIQLYRIGCKTYDLNLILVSENNK